MKKYDKYYPVNFEYVNQLPEGWRLLPNIAIFDARSEKGFTGEELLAVTIKRGIIKQSELENKKDISNEDKSIYKLVKKGDIAYNKMRMWQGAVGFSKYRGIVSPAYVVLKPKIKINPKYFHYQFRSTFYINQSKRFSYGICDDQLNLRWKDFKRMYSIVPPIDVQNEIVKLIEEKISRKNKFWDKKSQVIADLQVQKRLLIEDYIHHGLEKKNISQKTDSNYNLEIPNGWVVKPIKYLVKHISEQTKKAPANEPYMALENIESYFGKYQFQTENIDFESTVKRFKKGDILFSKLRPYLAKSIISTQNGICVGELLVLRPGKEILASFLNFILLSPKVIDFINSSTYGAKMPRANWEFIGRIPIAYPESIKTQQKIVNELNNELLEIDKAIANNQKEIELTQYYIDCYIFNLVAGRFQVHQNDILLQAAEPDFSKNYNKN